MSVTIGSSYHRAVIVESLRPCARVPKCADSGFKMIQLVGLRMSSRLMVTHYDRSVERSVESSDWLKPLPGKNLPFSYPA